MHENMIKALLEEQGKAVKELQKKLDDLQNRIVSLERAIEKTPQKRAIKAPQR